jgi:predicted transcriptional regulator
MSRRTTSHPTDGELEILDVLWRDGPLALGDICTALRKERDVATTTVATMLRVMHDKKLLRRKKGQRGYEWTAAVTPDDAARGMIGKLVDRVFDGSALRLAAHLVEAGQLSEDELLDLQRLIDRQRGESTNPKSQISIKSQTPNPRSQIPDASVAETSTPPVAHTSQSPTSSPCD